MRLRLMALTGLLTTLGACAAPPVADQNDHQSATPPQPLMPQPSSRMPSSQSRVTGEYIVTLPGETTDHGKSTNDDAATLIRQVFAAQKIRSIQALGQGLYLLKIGIDPGPRAMASLAGQSPQEMRVQPNRIYHNPTPPGPKIPLNH